MQTNFKTLRLFLEFLNEHQEIIISFLEALKLCKGKKKKEKEEDANKEKKKE